MARHASASFWRRAALAWAILILIILVLPGSSVPSVSFTVLGAGADKFTHAALFFVQALLLHGAAQPTDGARRRTMRLLAPAGVAILYGALTEIIQSQVPTRTADIGDVLFDTSGALLALLVVVAHRACARCGG